MKIKELNQIQESNSIDEIDEGLKDIATKFGKGIADRVTGRGPDREQRKSTKDREKRIDSTAKKAYHAWKDYEDHVAQSMAADDDRHDDFLNKGPEWQEYFRRWVAKNLLPDGQPIEAMSNARDIEAAVRKLSGGGAETFRQAEISPDQYSDLAKTRRAKAKAAGAAQPSAPQAPAAPAKRTATAPGGQFGDYRDVEDLAYDVGTGKMTPGEAQAEYKKRQQSRFPEAPPRGEPDAEPEAPTSRFAEPAVEPEMEPEPEAPAQQPILRDPNRATNGVERTSADPLIVKYDRHKYVVGDAGEWTKFGDKKPVDEILQKLLNDAADEFDENDAALDTQRSAQAAPTGHWAKDPKTGEQKWQPSAATPVGQAHAQAAPKGPEQLLPGQTRNAPSPEQAAAEKAAFKSDVDRQRAQGQADRERMEKEWQAADAADRAAGVEPPSRGIKKVSGHGQSAKFEPLKESVDEKIERDLFKTLVRAASLAEPTEGGEQAAPARGSQQRPAATRSAGGSAPRAPSGGGLVQDLLHQQGISSSASTGGQSQAPDMLQGLDLSHMKPNELRDYILRGMPKYHTLAEMGEFFRQAYGLQTNELSSTGNATVDQLLTKMGFSV